jgi:hypothetical protein
MASITELSKPAPQAADPKGLRRVRVEREPQAGRDGSLRFALHTPYRQLGGDFASEVIEGEGGEGAYPRGAGEIGMCEDPEFACDVEMRDKLKPRIGIAEIAGQDRSPEAGCGKFAGGDQAVAARGKSRGYIRRQPAGDCARRKIVVEADPAKRVGAMVARRGIDGEGDWADSAAD